MPDVSRVFYYIYKAKLVPILESESLERAKQNFIQSSERFVSAVNKITINNYNSLEQKLHLSSLHMQAIESYNVLMQRMGIIKLNG
ncbi:MAG TPA: hypothetical protein VEV62_19620 [Parafilimonas sp.]|jgi:hypothetical protein|nr:hypothetical protein [Parafilimonas sp.]